MIANQKQLSIYFSGSDVEIVVGSYVLDLVSYVQWANGSGVVPFYSCFSPNPRGVLQTNKIIKGQLGFNLKYANYLEALVQSVPGSKILGNGTIYFPSMIVAAVGNEIVPTFVFNDIYLSGGVKTAVPDGNPLQDVYQFISMSLVKRDEL